MIVMVVLNTKVFVKIFNKLSPLEAGDLKDAIHDLATDVGFDVKKIWVMDASRRSTKLNAFFSGFGKVKDVVLFDTLLDKLSKEEVLSVLAHELGHAQHKDVQKMMVRNIFVMGLYCFLFAGIYEFYGQSFAYSLLLFSILSQPINILIGVYFNYLSRKAEYRADAFSSKVYDGGHMICALKVLARENFSNLNPHPLYVSLHYSHPTIGQRIEALREAKN
jgi:STE24 endopeptidase